MQRIFDTPMVALAALLAGTIGAAAHSDHGHGHKTENAAHQEAERPELAFGRTEAFDYDPPEPGSYRLPPIKQAAGGPVIDAAGNRMDLAELMQGKITVLSLIYTRCADPRGCPAAVSLLHDIQYVSEQDPEIGDSVQLLSLSFDPAHDTPEVMAEYAAHHGGRREIGAEWRFLTTEWREDLEPILEAYGQTVALKADTADPFGPFYHQLRLFLIDREGTIRNIYSLGYLDPRLVITDIRTLLAEERTLGRRRQ